MKTKGILQIAAALLILGAPPGAMAQLELHGFAEAATGYRLGSVGGPPSEWGDVPSDLLPPVWAEQRDFTLRETRLQLKADLYGDVGEAHFVVDVLADEVASSGSGIDLRAAYTKFNAFGDHLEVRAGRQPTTWGTGDLLFINDLFPRDWVAFFSGRDIQYIRHPSDALRLGFFGLPVNVDFVYTPVFTPDVIPSGERFAFWTPAFVPAQEPAQTFENGEFALRLNRYFGSYSAAFYGYWGFWGQPQQLVLTPQGSPPMPMPSAFLYPELSVWGASVRGPLFGGVAWLEGGYYDSRENRDGTDPLTPGSEIRGLVGYERQWWSDFTGGLQLYWEGLLDHAATREALDAAFGPDAYLKSEHRTIVTLRLRQMLLYQTLTLGAFNYWSPSEEDGYVRLTVDYDYSDAVKLTVGANVFGGNDHRSMFAMNEDNDNVYARVRYSF